jgi:monoamine oxidase
LIEQGAVTEAFQQENLAAANIKSEVDKEALLRQFQAWDARAQMGSEVDSNKVRDGDQSATQAAAPRRSHLARRALGRLIEQGAVTEAFQQENPAAANIKSEVDKEALLRQFHAWDARAQFQAWDARAQMGSEVDSNKVRDGDQSATQAAPPRRSPPGATQAISTTDHPSSNFPERQYVFR